jgi:hypothetical protein
MKQDFLQRFVNYGGFSNKIQSHVGIILLSDQKATDWEKVGLFIVF